jgi:tRNA modification GTPase
VFSTGDTIVAVATPQGRGGIGVVRLSGPHAHDIACALLGRTGALEPRHATFARILERPATADPGHGDGRRPLDQVVATFFAAPHSYTLQDVVEISAHGSPPLLNRIVELGIAAGARLAEPGEFTFRAYLNGRLDLIQAEAVADLVDAVTPLQARAAMDQLEGTLTGVIRDLERGLFDLVARLEASLDFPDEGFHFITREELRAELETIGARLSALVLEGQAGRVIREGSLVVILGAPNAGKSSLFNALVGAARAIVTPIPGTTRDVLSETIDLNGLPVTVIDTAGLREAGDPIEAEGVRRAEQARDIAALSLVVVDSSTPIDVEATRRLLEGIRGPRLLVASKTDRPAVWDLRDLPAGAVGPASGTGDVVPVSVATGAGLDALRQRTVQALTSRDVWRDPPAVSNLRHVGLLREAQAAVARASAEAHAGSTEELVLAELTQARQALEAITGRTTTDELLHHIFGRFCIGK